MFRKYELHDVSSSCNYDLFCVSLVVKTTRPPRPVIIQALTSLTFSPRTPSLLTVHQAHGPARLSYSYNTSQMALLFSLPRTLPLLVPTRLNFFSLSLYFTLSIRFTQTSVPNPAKPLLPPY